MKSTPLKYLVLLVSVSAAGVLIWNATRNTSAEKKEKDLNGPEQLQASSKSAAIISSNNINEIIDQPAKQVVTDEDVKKTREMMMRSSKSGMIMSNEAIREMLEKQAEEKPTVMPQAPEESNLIPSTKNPGRVITREEIEKIFSERKETATDEAEPSPAEPDK